MTKILKSQPFYDELVEDLKQKIRSRKSIPSLNIIRLGENPADLSYEKGILSSAEKVGIPVEVHSLPRDEKEEEVLKLIEKINDNEKVGGLLIFRPLPEHLNEDRINEAIDPRIDLDCMTEKNKATIYEGDISGYIPLAPVAGVRLLEYYGYSLKGKNCTIINHSNVVGKPLAMILLAKWATVTLCHVETKNLKEHTRNADIVFTAMGRAESLDESYFTKDSIIIDIGLGRNKEGKMRGDLDAQSVDGKVAAYSPVPGGVGKITNLLLLENVLKDK